VSITKNSTSAISDYFQNELKLVSEPQWHNPPYNMSQIPNVDGLRAIWTGQQGELIVSDGDYDICVTAGLGAQPASAYQAADESIVQVVLASGFSS